MGNPFTPKKYLEIDIVNNAIDSGELHYKHETNGIVVVYQYNILRSCLLSTR